MDSGSRSCSDRDDLRYATGSASRDEITAHLLRCDSEFVPRLSERRDIGKYAEKIRELAVTFETWNGDLLVGLVAAYLNDPGRAEGFVTSVSVETEFRGENVADVLLEKCIAEARKRGFKRLSLEVGMENFRAVRLYRRHGFRMDGTVNELTRMALDLPVQA